MGYCRHSCCPSSQRAIWWLRHPSASLALPHEFYVAPVRGAIPDLINLMRAMMREGLLLLGRKPGVLFLAVSICGNDDYCTEFVFGVDFLAFYDDAVHYVDVPPETNTN